MESINKINLDINKEFEVTDASIFNNLALSLKTKNIISNEMNDYYNEFINSDYIANKVEDSSKYGINYLSEKFISINRFIYEYTGGAHGIYATIYSVYSLDNGDKLQIEDLIIDLKNTNLINLVKDKLLKIEGRNENSYFDLNELSLENNNSYIKELAYLYYKSDVYQVRMYGVFLFGYLSEDEEVLNFMKDVVSKDDNWRVQEILAKSFDEYIKKQDLKKQLQTIDKWLNDNNPNTRRSVIEGLRIWTNKPYFKERPNEAIKILQNLKQDNSEYVRKSVGNALKDISKKYPKLIKVELNSWKLDNKEIKQVYKLASKFIKV